MTEAALVDALARAALVEEVVVLRDPSADVLEAYGLDDQLGVIAWISGDAEQRAAALNAGALEVVHPDMPVEEAVARVETAVARFRSRLHLERAREEQLNASEELAQDLRLAARLQRSLLPQELPSAGVQFAAFYYPREVVSGDAYGVQEFGDSVVFYTLDSVGHGVRAALISILLRSALQPCDASGALRAPNEVLADLDRMLCGTRVHETPTAAFCYGVLDRQRGILEVSCAGHPPPVRLRPNGERVEIEEASGLLLGIQPWDYASVSVDLEPGDRVFFFTDGVGIDSGREFVEQLLRHRDLNLEEQVGGALGGVIELDAEGRPADDVTVLAVEYAPDRSKRSE
ncbi:MAG: serine/threonine-protein phosphatase [Planctomycetes bacterium]|nr:serine/threonine-protein phosphatase [Planctomycetota bacterium]